MIIVVNNGSPYYVELTGSKPQGEAYIREFTVFTSSCVTRDDIQKVLLKASGNDGWYVASINTYTAGYDQKYDLLTTDAGFSLWVDADEHYLYPYLATEHILTLVAVTNCITYVKVEAITGNLGITGSLKLASHYILIVLQDGSFFSAKLEGSIRSNTAYWIELHFTTRFRTTQCVRSTDIDKVYTQTLHGGNDAWYITSIIKTGVHQYKQITSDPNFYKWLVSNPTHHLLTWVYKDVPNCGYGKPVCECHANAKACQFSLEVDEIRTFTSYQKFPLEGGPGMYLRGTQGVIYYFDDNGIATPLQADRKCADLKTAECTDPQFVDGKTYRLAIGVNGQIPGPTLIVHENQIVTIVVQNNLTIEGISIHWHGMHQVGTPWMDGVGQVYAMSDWTFRKLHLHVHCKSIRNILVPLSQWSSENRWILWCSHSDGEVRSILKHSD